jgi:NAD(P)H-hydrate epimerase
MEILSAAQIQEADAYTIKHEPVTSIDLMERASRAFAEKLRTFDFISPAMQVDVYCGPGNNGGDGLAISRFLLEQGFAVRVFLLPSDKYSADYQTNLQRLKALKSPAAEIHEQSAGELLSLRDGSPTLIIDALFGTGLKKAAEGMAQDWIKHINAQKAVVIAVDVPSGLPCDSPPPHGAVVIKAMHTLTFGQPKLSFLFADHFRYTGYFHVLDIGLHKGFLESVVSPFTYITHDVASLLLNPREKFSHKGTYGHALLVAGSYGKMGAAVLASGACLRSGAGLLTVQAPACGYTILQSTVPEAMVIADSSENSIATPAHLDSFSVIGIGPGIGIDKQTQNVLKLYIQQSSAPMVIDADALNILSDNTTWLSFLPQGSILTPHPKEFERLIDKKGGSFDRFIWQREFSVKYSVYVVLKGAHTSVSCPGGEVFFNSTGNPGMAKGGSGDVLTGLLTGLLAQGYVPEEAAVFGVYLHGLAGDLAAEHLSMEAMTAGDLVSAFSDAFKAVLGC